MTPGPWLVEAVSDAIRITARIPSKDGMSRKPGGVKIILARLNPPQIPEAETHANARAMSAAPEMLAQLKECLLLFAKDHALDRFDWGKGALRAADIRELNELPLQIRRVIELADPGFTSAATAARPSGEQK